MNQYISNDHYKIYQGSMLNLLEVIEPNTIDSVVTDPPYELNFMNKGWDRSGIAFQKETWDKCYEVLKPGGYLLAFGGSRTFHRIAVAIEDAGFEIRDVIMWVYGSGFPKSHDISKALEATLLKGNSHSKSLRQVEQDGDGEPYTLKGKNNGILGEDRTYYRKKFEPSTEEAKQWQGWGTALKPAYEPIIVARKPLKGTVAQNVLKYGVGAINIDECRVGEEERFLDPATPQKGTFNASFDSDYDGKTFNGRFPANFIHDGSDEVTSKFPSTEAGGTPGRSQGLRPGRWR